MKNIKDLPYKKISVLGLARSGVAFLDKFKNSNIELAAWDDNEETRQKYAQSGFQIKSLEDGFLDGSDAIVISPGIYHTLPEPHPIAVEAKKRNIPIISDISIFKELRESEKTKLFAVTGTNGKSTTTTLLTHVINDFQKAEAGGNIGTAAFALEDDIDAAVLELSSYQLEITENLNADGVIWLNITPDHIDRHGDMDGYVAAKMRIFEKDHGTGQAVIACDDDYSRSVADKVDAMPQWNLTRVSVTQFLEKGICVQDSILYEDGKEIGSLKPAQNLKGEHNHQNAAAVYALVRAFYDRDPKTILERIISFGGLAHRQKKVKSIGDIVFINDSKATNADATSKALGSFDNIYWLAGGVAKEGGISSLTPFFPKIKKAYFYGEAADEFAHFSKDNKLAYAQSQDIQQALVQAFTDAQNNNGGVILLSPACASFDQFSSFEERGDYFIDLVEKL